MVTPKSYRGKIGNWESCTVTIIPISNKSFLLVWGQEGEVCTTQINSDQHGNPLFAPNGQHDADLADIKQLVEQDHERASEAA